MNRMMVWYACISTNNAYMKRHETCEMSPYDDHPHHESATRVLAITELLEQILLELPMRDLLLAQRVDQFWKHTIDGSPRIQRALYFEPVPPSRPDGLMHTTPTVNPLLHGPPAHLEIKGRPPKVCQRSVPVVYFDHGRFGKGLSAIQIVPGFKSQPWPRDGGEDADRGFSTFHVRVHLTAINETSRLRKGPESIDRTTKCFAEGSWRRMFLTQPLCSIYCTATPYFSGTCNNKPCRMREIWEAKAYVRLKVDIVGKLRSYKRPLLSSEDDLQLEGATGSSSEESQAWWKVWMRWQRST